MFFNMSIYDVITSRSQGHHFKTPTIIQRESGSGGPVIDHLLFLSKAAANLEGMYIFRKNNYCLPLATKHSLEIFSELKEIKHRNEVVEKRKRP